MLARCACSMCCWIIAPIKHAYQGDDIRYGRFNLYCVQYSTCDTRLWGMVRCSTSNKPFVCHCKHGAIVISVILACGTLYFGVPPAPLPWSLREFASSLHILILVHPHVATDVNLAQLGTSWLGNLPTSQVSQVRSPFQCSEVQSVWCHDTDVQANNNCMYGKRDVCAEVSEVYAQSIAGWGYEQLNIEFSCRSSDIYNVCHIMLTAPD